jgi:hypothetical protein
MQLYEELSVLLFLFLQQLISLQHSLGPLMSQLGQQQARQ